MNRSGDPSLPPDPFARHGCCEVADETIKRKSSGEMNEKNCCSTHDGIPSTAGSTDSRFSCNICFDEVTEPVVTRCGHLYCWPCLFQWLEPGMTREERESLGLSSFRHGGRIPSRRVCPVSKSALPLSAVVPLYIRSSPIRSKSTSSRLKEGVSDSNEMEPENDGSSNTPESRISAASEGLRRRRASHASFEDSNKNDNEPVPVPNRPSVTHPQHLSEPSSPSTSRRSSPGSSPRARASTDNPYRTGAVQLTPRSPNGHNGSLTYGILSSLQRATAEYYRTNSNTPDEPDRRRIPSLHDRRNHIADRGGRFRDSPQGYYTHYDEGNGSLNSETTQYLTRLLIMLTSFVIFCFLAV